MIVPVAHVGGWSRGSYELGLDVAAADWQQLEVTPGQFVVIAAGDCSSRVRYIETRGTGTTVTIVVGADFQSHAWVAGARLTISKG